jgi:hypothetical protein
MKNTILISACVSLISTFCLSFKAQAQMSVPNTIMPDPILLHPIGNVAKPEKSDLTQESYTPKKRAQKRCMAKAARANPRSTVPIRPTGDDFVEAAEAQGKYLNALAKCFTR